MNPVSLMADAGKLSIGQLQQAVKNGTVPAYIGIPMMQEKIKQAKQAQAPQAPAEPPIAQQVMAQASGIDQVPSNLPTQAMNDGGIVAFADGGLYDDEDDDYEERLLAQEEAEHQGIMSQYQQMEDAPMQRGGGSRAAPAARTESPSGTSSVSKSENINSTPNVEGGIRGVVTEAANKYGLPPELLQRISGSESSHNPRAKNSASSAEGLFQFIPSTWAGMGGKPGEQSDPVKNADLGGKFIRQNAETLKRQLGRNPNYDEVYAAHYFGPGVTAMLKNATPDMPIEQGLRMFNSEKFVPVIMQQNPNLRGKTVGQVMGSLREKMGDGQVQLANGGIARLNKGGVPRFQSGLLVTDEEKRAEEERDRRNQFRNPDDYSTEAVKERLQVMDDRFAAGRNNQFPSPIGTLQGAERDRYIAGLTQPKKEDTSSPAGRFVSGLFTQTPSEKKLQFERQSALNDRNRVMQNFNSNPFATQSKEGYQNAQNAIEQANANVAQANRGGGYTPPDPYGNYIPNVPASLPSSSTAPSLLSTDTTELERRARSYPAPAKAGVDALQDTNATTNNTTNNGTTTDGKKLTANVGAKENSDYKDFMDYFKKGHEDLKSQKQEDKYMAILQAGLGMMAGTSPNALANIGQGASMGVAQYGASAKQRAAEQNALLKGEMTARRYQEMGEDRRSAQKIAENRYNDALDYRSTKDTNDLDEKESARLARTEGAISKQIDTREKAIEAMVNKEYENIVLQSQPNAEAKKAARIAQLKAEDPVLNRHHKSLGTIYPKVFGFDYEAPNYNGSATSGFKLLPPK